MSGFLDTMQRLSCLGDGSDSSLNPLACLQFGLSSRAPSKSAFVAPQVLLTPYPTLKHKQALASFLEEREGQWMFWNVSEVKHCQFPGQTVEFVYKGWPNLPLLDLFLVCISINSWVQARPEHIALVHCQASRTRALIVGSCYLRWSFSQCFSSLEAFRASSKLFAACGPLTPANARYLYYFDRVLCEGIPTFRRLRLKTIQLPSGLKQGTLYICMTNSEAVKIEVDSTEVEVNRDVIHDVLIRYRVTDENTRKTVFKLMFNTSFVKGLEITLDEDDLDLGDAAQLYPHSQTLKLVFGKNECVQDTELAQGWRVALNRRARERRNHRMDQVGHKLQKKKYKPDEILDELFGD